MTLMKKFVSLTTVAIEIVKRHFLNDQWKMLQEKKRFIKKIQTSTEKTKLIGYLVLCEIKLCNLKNVHFLKKEPKKFNIKTRNVSGKC